MSNKPTLLVIDDEEHIRLTLRFALNQQYNMHLAGSSQTAMDILSTVAVDLVILDIKMLNESGLDLLPKIKAKDPLVEVIMLTGYATMEHMKSAWDNEAFTFLSKPPDLKLLQATLKKAYATRQRNLMLKEGLSNQTDKQKEVTNLQNGVIHDVNNLLTIAAGLSQIAQMKLEKKETLTPAEVNKMRQDFQEIEKQLMLCSKISRSHLRVFSLAVGESTNSADIFEMTNNLCTLLKCHESVMHVTYDFSPVSADLGRTETPQIELFQVLLNLTLNAGQSKATKHKVQVQIVPTQPNLSLTDGPNRKVLGEESYKADQAYLAIKIQDTGDGIPPARLQTLFSAPTTTKPTGTGIGLQLIRNLVLKNKLILNITSQEKVGTSVILFIPIVSS